MKYILQSWNYRRYDFTYALDRARAYGWDGIELSKLHINLDAFDTAITPIMAKAKEYGLPIYVVDAGIICESPDTVAQSKGTFEVVCRGLEKNHIPILNVTTCFGKKGKPNDDVVKETAALLRETGDFCKTIGVKVVIETHLFSLAETVSQTLTLIDRTGSDNVGVNLDPGNLVRADGHEDPVEAIGMCGNKLGHVHAKNLITFGGEHRNTPLAEGDIDYGQFIAALHRHRYTGPVAMENGSPGCPNDPAEKDIRFFRDIASQVAAGLPV
jgi:sugar phosphate isomerase/epimerase